MDSAGEKRSRWWQPQKPAAELGDFGGDLETLDAHLAGTDFSSWSLAVRVVRGGCRGVGGLGFPFDRPETAATVEPLPRRRLSRSLTGAASTTRRMPRSLSWSSWRARTSASLAQQPRRRTTEATMTTTIPWRLSSKRTVSPDFTSRRPQLPRPSWAEHRLHDACAEKSALDEPKAKKHKAALLEMDEAEDHVERCVMRRAFGGRAWGGAHVLLLKLRLAVALQLPEGAQRGHALHVWDDRGGSSWADGRQRRGGDGEPTRHPRPGLGLRHAAPAAATEPTQQASRCGRPIAAPVSPRRRRS